jgi:sugar lactone lactonase YvrE
MTMDGVSVFSDHICELGEGPSYDPATDTLFWFDIVNGKLLESRSPARWKSMISASWPAPSPS